MSKSRKIVLIMTDTQGTNMVGCYGRPELKTTALDGLAAQGVRFTQAYTCSPVCGPARSALFTGTYPHTNGSWGNDMPLGTTFKTIGERCTDGGMHCGYVGKWHLSGSDYFDDGQCPAGWDPRYWYDMRCYLKELGPERAQRSRKLDNAAAIKEAGITEDDTYAHRCSNRAIDFLDNHHDEDFLLCVSYDEPHHPFTCPPPWCDMFEEYRYPLGENAFDTLEDKPEHIREWAAAVGIERRKEIDFPMYFGANAFVDYEIGRVLQAVDTYAPDALVIFTSDHGDPLFTHGLTSKGPAMFKETTNIPLIMRMPGTIPAGTVSDTALTHIDIVPTILDLANIAIPDILEGESLMPQLPNPESAGPREAFVEFNRYEVDHDGWGGFQPIRCVVDGNYKLVINLLSSDELYNIKDDPEEMTNLISSPKSAEIRDRLHDSILDWMDRTRDPFRGICWERRPWRTERKRRWNGPTRPRPDDGYKPRVLSYETGKPVENYVEDKN